MAHETSKMKIDRITKLMLQLPGCELARSKCLPSLWMGGQAPKLEHCRNRTFLQNLDPLDFRVAVICEVSLQQYVMQY